MWYPKIRFLKCSFVEYNSKKRISHYCPKEGDDDSFLWLTQTNNSNTKPSGFQFNSMYLHFFYLFKRLLGCPQTLSALEIKKTTAAFCGNEIGLRGNLSGTIPHWITDYHVSRQNIYIGGFTPIEKINWILQSNFRENNFLRS